MIGHVVERTAHPRFRLTMRQQDDGSWIGNDPEWIDPPEMNAPKLARLMRETGDYFAANRRRDWIQDCVIERSRELGLNARMIRDATGGAVSENHLHDYLSRRASMGSHKLAAVLRVLGLRIEIEK